MDIVVHTPHGDADVSIAAHDHATTLGEIVSEVTGQAVPRLVMIDDRLVDAATPIGRAGLCVGSVVTTDPPTPSPAADGDVEIAQIAGHGAGRTSRLGVGSYRIGPGRRSGARELDSAPVDRTMIELVIEQAAASSTVTVVPGDDAIDGVTIDGVRLTTATVWDNGLLTVGSRVFVLDNPARSDSARAVAMANSDGTVAFSRPPRRASPPERRPVIDATRDAARLAPWLWERRPSHDDALLLPIGVGIRDDAIVSADLGVDRALAITGSERFRESLVRTIIVEAVSVLGPADLELVVMTGPDRLAHWDWAKWLPHVRIHGTPSILSAHDEIAGWQHQAIGAASPGDAPHLTMVILDDPDLWNRRDAPARSIVSHLPDQLRLIALCADSVQAPAACTASISQDDGDVARLEHAATDNGGTAIRPALTEVDVAARLARALAPLDDLELPAAETATLPPVESVELSELVGAADVEQVVARWATSDPRPTAAIGRRGGDLIELPVADDVTVVVGPSMGDAFDVAATSILAQCVARSPDRLWIAPIARERTARSELLWQLPHATEPHDSDSPIEPQRLLARLRSVLADPDGPDRIVLVAESTGVSPSSSDQAWLVALADDIPTINGLAMIVVTDRSDMAGLDGDSTIRVERRSDAARSDPRRMGTISTAGVVGQPFSVLQPSARPTPTLDVRAYAIGRALSPLERRIERHRQQTENAPDRELAGAVAMLRDAATHHGPNPAHPLGGRTVVPPPIPTSIDLEHLFDTAPGDGVPLGLVDDPSSAGTRTWWWEPGSGSMLVFGSRRSGTDQVLATIMLGVIDRFSDHDVRLIVIESSSAVRRTLNGIERSVRVVAPDQANEVSDALDEISAELDRRSAPPGAGTERDRPHLVVLIGDLVQLRRKYIDQPLGARLDELLERAVRSGLDVVAFAADLDGAGSFASSAPSRVVGASSNHHELSTLGVGHPAELDGVVGRCRLFPGGDLAQIALAEATTETLLGRRSTGDAS